MQSKWRKTTLGEVVRLQRGHDLPEKERHRGSVPVMGSFGVTGHHNIAKAKGPGVTIGRSGASIGVVSFVKVDYWPLNTCLYVTDFQGNDPRFCYYWLKTLDLAAFNSGSAQPSLNRNYVYGLPAEIPELDEQRAIAGLLGAIDDRIELLDKVSTTLEAIAQTIFKSWFVDFDQIKAKAEGHDPQGMDSSTVGLFPDRFQNSKIGEIPNGWGLFPLTRQVELGRETVTPMAHPDDEFEHFSIPAFDEGRAPKRELGIEIKSNKTRVPKDCVLVSKLNPTIPRVWLPAVTKPSHAVCSTEFLVFLPRAHSSREYIYCLCCDSTFRQRLVELTTGTSNSHQRVMVSDLMNEEFCFPADDILKAYTDVTKPVLARVAENIENAQVLRGIRDALLPRLISGQIRMCKAEQIVSEVRV